MDLDAILEKEEGQTFDCKSIHIDFEDRPVIDASVDDLDLDFVSKYTEKIGYSKSPMEYLYENKGFVKDIGGVPQISTAAILKNVR